MIFRRRFWFIGALTAALMFAAVFVFTTTPAQAQSKTLRWHRWDADIQINRDGTFHVAETYEIEFIGGTFTFGYRNIPKDQYEGLRDFSVLEGATVYQETPSQTPNTFYVQENADEYVVNWFYPSTTDQTRTFTVEYTVEGGIIISSDVGDRFFWKAVGPDHDFPIESSTVTIRMPEGEAFEFNTSVPSPYYYGADATYAVADDKSSVTYQVNYIPEGQYFEVGIRFPHGIVPDVKPSWQAAYEQEQNWDAQVRRPLNLGLGALSILMLIGGLGGVYLLWLFAGRDPQVGPVPSYLTEPPSDLPPAVAGTLIDEKADLQDIISTVVDMARRGVIEMEEHENKILGITASRTFTFRKVEGSTEAIRPFERQLLDDMFGSRHEIDLDDLNQKFYSYVPRLQKMLYEETVKEGLFPISPKAIRGRYLGLGIVGIVLSSGVGFCAAAGLVDRIDAILCPFMALGLASAALMIISGSMPVKTRKGAEEAAKWRAFKTYLQNTERFTDLQQVTDQFEKYLPYAIAFGLERGWINKFSRIPSTPMPRWYIPYGYGPYYGGAGQSTAGGGHMTRPASGGRDLRGEAVRPAPSLDQMSGQMMGGLNAMSAGLMSMLNSTATTFTSVPQSSGGGGGGGFSGGGFSGGGGGGGGGAGFG